MYIYIYIYIHTYTTYYTPDMRYCGIPGLSEVDSILKPPPNSIRDSSNKNAGTAQGEPLV